ncbi:MAG: 2-oxo acid dehydrogenase subunit E2 [Acidobacteria bacterium]|nr:2-oxo acid dehydrogenase subunit E2 [Acidobacteriota bacterium]
MPTPVLMPQMGESIAEGTIVRWLKRVGEPVDRDEPLFEISTDKVDAEIPSPAAGVLSEIRVVEGETVAVDSVVGTIGEAGTVVQPEDRSPVTPAPLPDAPRDSAGATGGALPAPPAEVHQGHRQRTSPLVRRIAREHSLNVAEVEGSGAGGRVTKRDILAHLEGLPASRTSKATMPTGPGGGVEIEPLSILRRKIAEHMILSRRTSAHVHTVFQVNFATVDALRRAHKADYERRGVKLTYMAFITKAVVDALRRFPLVNASLDGDRIIYKHDVNVGIAVAIEGGLIVPVVKRADAMNLFGLSRAIRDVADRARARQLKADDVQDGTFTITNPGQFGSQFGLPIINQPQLAILGVGTVEKRPVVIDDAIGIRPMGYLTLGFDHRVIDGALADEFMASVKASLEHFDPEQV